MAVINWQQNSFCSLLIFKHSAHQLLVVTRQQSLTGTQLTWTPYKLEQDPISLGFDAIFCHFLSATLNLVNSNSLLTLAHFTFPPNKFILITRTVTKSVGQ